MPHAFIIKPEVPYHMHGGGDAPNKWTSAICGTVDYGEILSGIEFEGLLDGSPSWCCEKCAAKYQENLDQFIARAEAHRRKQA